jgi:hypothetical protein
MVGGRGGVAERSNAPVLKTGGRAPRPAGSNPAPAAQTSGFSCNSRSSVPSGCGVAQSVNVRKRPPTRGAGAHGGRARAPRPARSSCASTAPATASGARARLAIVAGRTRFARERGSSVRPSADFESACRRFDSSRRVAWLSRTRCSPVGIKGRRGGRRPLLGEDRARPYVAGAAAFRVDAAPPAQPPPGGSGSAYGPAVSISSVVISPLSLCVVGQLARVQPSSYDPAALDAVITTPCTSNRLPSKRVPCHRHSHQAASAVTEASSRSQRRSGTRARFADQFLRTRLRLRNERSGSSGCSLSYASWKQSRNASRSCRLIALRTRSISDRTPRRSCARVHRHGGTAVSVRRCSR